MRIRARIATGSAGVRSRQQATTSDRAGRAGSLLAWGRCVRFQPTVKATVSNLVNYRVEVHDGGPADGSIRFLCSYQCAERFLAATHSDDDDLRRDAKRIKTSCVHCAWCSTLVAVPAGGCVMHGDDCPQYEPLATVRAGHAVLRLQRRSGRRLPDRAMSYLEETIGGHAVLGKMPALNDLVDRVWDLRIDWLP